MVDAPPTQPPRPLPARPARPGFSSRFWAIVIAPSGLIGTIGILLLIAAGGVTAFFWFHARAEAVCRVDQAALADAGAAGPGFAIVRAQPVEWQFRKHVCLIVRNVVPAGDMARLQAGVASAQAALDAAPVEKRAAARTDLAAAQAALKAVAAGFDYRLFVNGQPSELTAHALAEARVQPLLFSVMPEEDATSTTGTFWRKILAQPTKHGRVPIEIGLAPKESAAPATSTRTTMVDGEARPITFLLYEPIVMWLTLGGICCLLVGLCGLAYKTALVRVGDTNLTSYSLSRVQMAFWLVLSTCGFLYVWMVTGQYVNVFPSALFVLIGISGATAGAAQLIDAPRQLAPTSNSFFHDIAGAWDGGEVQLHRLQIIAWTVILGCIFCWNVVANLQLTSFDTNLLLLAGVANGVYVSLKTQEQPAGGGQDAG